MIDSWQLDKVLEKVRLGAFIITPNLRLSLFFKQKFGEYMKKEQIDNWTKKNIYSFSQLINVFWNSDLSGTSPLLIDSSLVHHIWKRKIINSENSNSIILKAIQAYRYIQEYEISMSDLTSSIHTEESTQFIKWYNSYISFCSDKNLIDEYTLLTYINNSSLIDMKDKTLIFTCFDDLSPTINTTIRNLSKSNKIVFFDNKNISLSMNRTNFQSIEDEFTNMILWSKDKFNNNPEETIACVIPSLKNHREDIDRICKEIFIESSEKVYNFSAGKPLIKYHMIKLANILLSIKNKTSLLSLSAIVRSPFIQGSFSESFQRSNLITKIYSLEEEYISIDDVIKLSAIKDKSYYCPILNNILIVLQNKSLTKKTPSLWIQYIVQFLHQCGWPGDRTLNSEEYQTISKFYETLNLISQFDVIYSSISFQDIVSILKDILKKQEFQPTTSNKPIQFLGLLESAGQTFDHLWVSGITIDKFPQTCNPNPFIPISIQKKYNLPHSNSERELDFSRKILLRLSYSAKHSIFSYAKNEGNKEKQESNLISYMEHIDFESKPIQTRVMSVYNTRKLNIFDDYYLNKKINGQMKGGSYLFKNFFECNFKSIAKYRLNPVDIVYPKSGISIRKKGNIIHKTLELFWQEIKDQKKLHSLTEVDLGKLMYKHVNESIKSEISTFFIKNNKNLIFIEINRIIALIHNLILLEKKRPNFECLNVEKNSIISIGNISLKIRIDRIDRIDNNDYMLIDYKTGNIKKIDWLEAKLDDPQLPIYCITSTLPIKAISFANVNVKSTEITGISNNESGIEGIKTIEEIYGQEYSWEQLKEQWKKIIFNASHDIYNGKALINPKKGSLTCSICNIKPLCGIKRITNNDL